MSEIIFDIPSANLGILLIFLATTLIIRFSLDFADERAGIGFFRQPACAEILDFGVGFAVIASACPPIPLRWFLPTPPPADRCAVDLSAAPRSASRFPCEMVVRVGIGTACATGLPLAFGNWPSGA